MTLPDIGKSDTDNGVNSNGGNNSGNWMSRSPWWAQFAIWAVEKIGLPATFLIAGGWVIITEIVEPLVVQHTAYLRSQTEATRTLTEATKSLVEQGVKIVETERSVAERTDKVLACQEECKKCLVRLTDSSEKDSDARAEQVKILRRIESKTPDAQQPK